MMDIANSNELVSIIVPVYNCENYLAETLDSIIAQSHFNWECIIVNDGSTDKSESVALQFCKKNKQFKYLYQHNAGQAAARNNAIEHSKGKYILPVDADDLIKADYIQKAVAILEKNQDVKIVYCEANFFGERSGKWNLPDFTMEEFLIDNIIFCTALFRKKDFNLTKGYNSQIVKGFEDWDLWISLLETGGEVYKIPEVLFFYRIRPGSTSYEWKNEKLILIREQMLANHTDIYKKYFTDNYLYILYQSKKYEKKYNSIINSYDYKIGKHILSPIRFLKKLLISKA